VQNPLHLGCIVCLCTAAAAAAASRTLRRWLPLSKSLSLRMVSSVLRMALLALKISSINDTWQQQQQRQQQQGERQQQQQEEHQCVTRSEHLPL
jgi:hypothetical protein